MARFKNQSKTQMSTTRSTKGAVPRRDFIKSAALAGAAFAAPASVVGAQRLTGSQTAPRAGAVPIVTQTAETTPPSDGRVLTQDSSGSDFMIDVMKSLDIPYVFANPAATFRGLQESVINHGGNTNPEFITCVHEEQSAAMAHGYFKVEGKPAAIMAHSVVGLQHASMAIYNAFVDRVPIYVMLGNIMDARMRITSDQWYHSVQDPAVMVRDYIKWDDEPVSLQHFAESAVRAYKIAMTAPTGPVVITVDAEMAERPIPAAEQRNRLRSGAHGLRCQSPGAASRLSGDGRCCRRSDRRSGSPRSQRGAPRLVPMRRSWSQETHPAHKHRARARDSGGRECRPSGP